MEDIKKGQINYGKVWPEHEAEFYLNHSCDKSDDWHAGIRYCLEKFRNIISNI